MRARAVADRATNRKHERTAVPDRGITSNTCHLQRYFAKQFDHVARDSRMIVNESNPFPVSNFACDNRKERMGLRYGNGPKPTTDPWRTSSQFALEMAPLVE